MPLSDGSSFATKLLKLDSLGRINNTIKLQKETVHLFVAQWYLTIKSLTASKSEWRVYPFYATNHHNKLNLVNCSSNRRAGSLFSSIFLVFRAPTQRATQDLPKI